jgi:murein DD-endopeptidase MepM/ murein hydrolase activator NlpD
VAGQKAPPFPLTSAEPHVEPDLVGTTHVVQKGETLYRIARTYGIDPAELMEANGIGDPRTLAPGQELFVPGAPRALDAVPLPGNAAAPEPEPLPRKNPAAKMRWPVQGVLYRGFGVRQGQRHDGIDISAPEGTLVRAAAGGEVIYTGSQSGYGVIVIVRHPDALVTLYAHNSAVLVKDGDRVDAGTPIAKVGQSGRTTGPHLHFEVREGTRPRDPIPFLP